MKLHQVLFRKFKKINLLKNLDRMKNEKPIKQETAKIEEEKKTKIANLGKYSLTKPTIL